MLMLFARLAALAPGGSLGTVPATAQLVPPSQISTMNGARIGFWVIAAIVIGGALFTITRRNAVAAVMSLVATFFGLAACYVLLYAHFLAALQVLVYAGAIMVLFIFVVMVLNRDDPERVAPTGLLAKAFGIGVTGYFLFRLTRHLVDVQPRHLEAPPASFGTVADVGNLLFTDYLFAFEAVSILLLIAVIAAVVVARAHKPAADAADGDDDNNASPPSPSASASTSAEERHS
jgi:NADH-quinone oxidoreductase subunit J